uniref:Uncharacterized protein n=1 Tax=Knipowitschia caucasica TaxID=637954 RepID=A0AAV2KTT2_KNICA
MWTQVTAAAGGQGKDSPGGSERPTEQTQRSAHFQLLSNPQTETNHPLPLTSCWISRRPAPKDPRASGSRQRKSRKQSHSRKEMGLLEGGGGCGRWGGSVV